MSGSYDFTKFTSDAKPEKPSEAEPEKSQPFPDAQFGSASEEDSGEADLPDTDEEDDDEELVETPPDVIAMLGFDPKEEDSE